MIIFSSTQPAHRKQEFGEKKHVLHEVQVDLRGRRRDLGIQIFKNGEDLRWRAYLHTYLSVSESEEVRGGVRASYSQRKRKELTLLTY